MVENPSKESSQQTAKKRFSPVKIALIILALLFSVFVVKIILLITGKPTISIDYLSRYNKISKPENYDPNENAATYYEEAFGTLVDMPYEISELRKVWPADMNRADFDAVKNWLTSNSQALGYLKEAVQKPYYWVEVKSEDGTCHGIDTSFITPFREAAYCFNLQARLQASQDHIRAAFENVVGLHKMGTHYYGSKMLIQQLIGMAFSGMASETGFTILDREEIDSTSLADFQSQLEQILQSQKLLSFAGEKIFAYDTIQHCFTDNGKGDGQVMPVSIYMFSISVEYSGDSNDFTFESISDFRVKGISYPKSILIALTHPGKKETMELTNELYGFLDDLIQKTPWQLRSKGTSYRDEIQKITEGNYFVNHVIYPNTLHFQLWQEKNAEIEALITTIAILRYKAEKGRLPENLDQLVSTGYLRQLPMDPYSDSTLVYKLIGDDFMLYSLGADFDDDGGVYSDWGKWQGGDQVFWPVQKQEENRTE